MTQMCVLYCSSSKVSTSLSQTHITTSSQLPSQLNWQLHENTTQESQKSGFETNSDLSFPYCSSSIVSQQRSSTQKNQESGDHCSLRTPRPICGSTSRPTYRSTYRPMLDRYVGRHIDRLLADVLIEMCRSTCRPTYRPISQPICQSLC